MEVQGAILARFGLWCGDYHALCMQRCVCVRERERDGDKSAMRSVTLVERVKEIACNSPRSKNGGSGPHNGSKEWAIIPVFGATKQQYFDLYKQGICKKLPSHRSWQSGFLVNSLGSGSTQFYIASI